MNTATDEKKFAENVINFLEIASIVAGDADSFIKSKGFTLDEERIEEITGTFRMLQYNAVPLILPVFIEKGKKHWSVVKKRDTSFFRQLDATFGDVATFNGKNYMAEIQEIIIYTYDSIDEDTKDSLWTVISNLIKIAINWAKKKGIHIEETITKEWIR